MTTGLFVPDRRSGYIEGPRGYYSLPADLVESPAGSGLYLIPSYLIEAEEEGLYLIPVIESQDYFFGGRSNIDNYSVTEEATPTDPGSMEGGAGQVVVNFNEGVDTLRLTKEVVQFSDTYRNRGMIEGVVRELSISDGAVSMTMDSALALFNSDHVVPPQRGRLDTVLTEYCRIVGVSNTLYVHPSLASRQVVYPGWVGNVWEHLKQIMSRESAEMALIGDTITVRPIRSVEAVIDNDESRSVMINDQSTAKAVEIAYYNNRWANRDEVYPVPGEDPTIYTVDAGETITVEVQLSASLVSVNQPTCISFVQDRPYPATDGVYSVAGNDGKPITPAQWNAQGGSVKVRLTDDPSVIEITITGASMTEYAPYRIAMTAGTGSYYNSLHITGTGVMQERKVVKIPTGASSAVTGEDVGTLVENPFVSSRAEAYSLGVRTAGAWAGVQTTTGTSTSVQPTEEDAQAFGNTAGARIRRGHAMYRVKHATIDPVSVAYTADIDTTVADFNEVWPAGTKVSDFNAMWSGKLVKDFNVEPLRRDQT